MNQTYLLLIGIFLRASLSLHAQNQVFPNSPLMMFGEEKKTNNNKDSSSSFSDEEREARERHQTEDDECSDSSLLTPPKNIPTRIERASLTLNDFRNIATTHPPTTYFLLRNEEEDMLLEPRTTSPSVDSENQKILRNLKDLITAEYSLEIANNISELGPMAFLQAAPLSAARIITILNKLPQKNKLDSIINIQQSEIEKTRLAQINKATKSATERLASASHAREKASAARARGNSSLAELWDQVAAQFQTAVEHYQIAAESFSKGNEEATIHSTRAGKMVAIAYALESAATAFEEASEATEQNNTRLAELWNKTASRFQEATTYYHKAAAASAADNTEEVTCFSIAAIAARSSADQLKLAASAFEKTFLPTLQTHAHLVELYQKTIQLHQEIAEDYNQVAEIYAQKKERDSTFFDQKNKEIKSNVDRLKLVSKALEKILEATIREDVSSAELWSKTAEQFQEAIIHFRQATQAIKLGDNSKGFCCAKIGKYTQAHGYALNKTAAVLEQTSSTAATTSDSHSPKNLIRHIKTVDPLLKPQNIVGSVWLTKAAKSHTKASSALENSSKATIQGNLALAELWNQIATQFQIAAEFYHKTAEALSRGCENEFARFSQAGKFSKSSTDQLKSAVSALQKASEATIEKNITLADSWHKIVEENRKLAEAFQQIVKIYAQEITAKNDDLLNQTIKQVQSQVNQLKSTSSLLDNSSKATVHDNDSKVVSILKKISKVTLEENPLLVELINQMAEQLKEAVSYEKQAKEASTQAESDTFVQKSKRAHANAKELKSMASALNEAIRTAAKQETTPLAKLWHKIAERRQKLAEQYRQAAIEYEPSQAVDPSQTLSDTGSHTTQLTLASLALEKAAQATALGNAMLAMLWNKSASLHQEAAEHYDQASKAAENSTSPEALTSAAHFKIWWQQYAAHPQRDLVTMEGGYLFPMTCGGFYNGQSYTDHALERMAPATPKIIKMLEMRAMRRAKNEGFQFDADSLQQCLNQPSRLKKWWKQHKSQEKKPSIDFQKWWHDYGPQPREILPATVEAEIASPGTTNVSVIINGSNHVITVIPRKLKK